MRINIIGLENNEKRHHKWNTRYLAFKITTKEDKFYATDTTTTTTTRKYIVYIHLHLKFVVERNKIRIETKQNETKQKKCPKLSLSGQ